MLSDKEFQKIMDTNKYFIKKDIKLCKVGDIISYNLISNDERKFTLDVDRKGKFELNKVKIQNRLESIPLIRLEIDAPPHINPDGTRVSRNHIHIYKEDFGLRWAYELDKFDKQYFNNINIFYSLFIDFCNFCNIDTYNLKNLQGVI